MEPKIKIAIITAARSEYGLLRWIIKDIENDSDFESILIVTGAHLSPEQGMTVGQIKADGHKIAHTVEFLISSQSDTGVAKSNGLGAISMADVLSQERPDILLVLGDRYELLGICSTALLLGIPIAHISGGDITEGAIDNQIRNAVTMMADLHFPGTEQSAQNIRRMMGSNLHIYPVGEPGLDSFIREKRLSRQELAETLGLDPKKNWILCTLHPETRESVDYSVQMAKNLTEAFRKIQDCEIIITASNADTGGAQMNKHFKEVANSCNNIMFVYSLGHQRYLSMMNEAYAVVGNSSSGIVEAPFLGIPVINIGDRQRGRHICTNVVNVKNNVDDIVSAMNRIPEHRVKRDNYFGDGNTSKKVICGIKDFMKWKKM